MAYQRILARIALAALIPLASACSGESNAEETAKAPSDPKKELIGYWQSSVSLDGKDLFFQFTDDGKFIHNRSYMTGDVKWMRLDGGGVVFTYTPNNIQKRCDISVKDGKVLILKKISCVPDYDNVSNKNDVVFIKQ